MREEGKNEKKIEKRGRKKWNEVVERRKKIRKER